MYLAREHGMTCVGVAVHPGATPSHVPEADVAHQATKLREADFALTRFINRAEDCHRFIDMMASRGGTTPVIPGLRIISNVWQAARMAAVSGVPVPVELLDWLDVAVGDPETGRRIGVEHTLHVCRRLLDGGAPGLHFYTMNRAAGTLEVCQALG